MHKNVTLFVLNSRFCPNRAQISTFPCVNEMFTNHTNRFWSYLHCKSVHSRGWLMKTSKCSSPPDYKVITVSVVISDGDVSCDKNHPRVFTCCWKNTSAVILHDLWRGWEERSGGFCSELASLDSPSKNQRCSVPTAALKGEAIMDNDAHFQSVSLRCYSQHVYLTETAVSREEGHKNSNSLHGSY